jgi:hypothetical protein
VPAGEGNVTRLTDESIASSGLRGERGRYRLATAKGWPRNDNGPAPGEGRPLC